MSPFRPRQSGTALLALAILACLPALSPAAEPRRHDPGLFFRFSIGPGTAVPAADLGGTVERVEMSGGTIELDLAAGWTVRENLALHATVFGWSLANPHFERSLPGTSGVFDGSVTLSTYGIGATWFAMPINAHVTGSVGVGRVTFEFPDLGVADQTKPGVAFTAGVGKEWWMSDIFGLGMSGYFTWFSAEDSTVPTDWSGPAYGLRACLTLN